MRKAYKKGTIFLTGILTILFIIPNQTLRTDTVIFKNGKRIFGKVLTQTENDLLFRTRKRGLTIAKKKIDRITYESLARSLQLEKERKRRIWLRWQRDKLRRMKIQARLIRNQFLSQQAAARAARARLLRIAVKQKKIKKPDEAIEAFDFIWRSALIPGWGHVHMKNRFIGYGYMIGFGAAVINYYDKRKPALDADEKNQEARLQNFMLLIPSYRESVPQNFQWARLWFAVEANRLATGPQERIVDNYHYSLYILAGVYAFQLVHAILHGFAWEKGFITMKEGSASVQSGFSLSLMPAQPQGEMQSYSLKRGLSGSLQYTFVF